MARLPVRAWRANHLRRAGAAAPRAEAPPRAQIYKLADDFTFSGSEETFSQLQASLEGLEARGATPSPPELSCVAGD